MFLSDTDDSWWSSLDTSDHSSKTWSILLVNGLFFGLVALVVSLRIFTKVFTRFRLFADDYMIIASTLIFFVACALNIRAADLGFGKHIWDLPGLTGDSSTDDVAAAASKVLKMNYIALTILAPAIILGKLSVVALLIRIFPSSMRALRYFLISLGVIITACCTTQAITVIFQCSPVPASWDIESSSCQVPLQAVVFGLGALNTATDVLICVAPVPVYWKLKISRPQKICLSGLFLCGLFACAISIVRLLSLRGLNTDPDVTYAAVPYFTWSVVEIGLIIMTGSVPSLRPLVATILPDFFKERNFTSLFDQEKRSAGTQFRTESSYARSTTGIFVTQEFHVEELEKQKDYAMSPLPHTPRSQIFFHGPRAVVTCERMPDDAAERKPLKEIGVAE